MTDANWWFMAVLGAAFLVGALLAYCMDRNRPVRVSPAVQLRREAEQAERDLDRIAETVQAEMLRRASWAQVVRRP